MRRTDGELSTQRMNLRPQCPMYVRFRTIRTLGEQYHSGCFEHKFRKKKKRIGKYNKTNTNKKNYLM